MSYKWNKVIYIIIFILLIMYMAYYAFYGKYGSAIWFPCDKSKSGKVQR